MKIGEKEFDFAHHTYVMGILNVTPDSFSDGGKFEKMDAALKHVEEMISDGAALIDIGGESTRPGFESISAREEMERVGKVIEEVKKRFDIPVSVDTYKAPVMDEAFRAGADFANDIWGLRYDSLFSEEGRKSVWETGTMAEVVAKHRKPVCIMHNRKEPVKEEFLREVFADFHESLEIAKKAGIKKEQIILDPGIGFGKTY
ncbi:MAG: dihydropteroate synthase, partial [Lachnospiraceae bacterium]|nr:dihydropteroate synthase [Lachnospiraceae bacterium]